MYSVSDDKMLGFSFSDSIGFVDWGQSVARVLPPAALLLERKTFYFRWPLLFTVWLPTSEGKTFVSFPTLIYCYMYICIMRLKLLTKLRVHALFRVDFSLRSRSLSRCVSASCKVPSALALTRAARPAVPRGEPRLPLFCRRNESFLRLLFKCAGINLIRQFTSF